MRKLIFFNMATLDGFFEDQHRKIDWHVVDEAFNDLAIEQLDSVDTILFGRLTYQLMAAYWPTKAAIKDSAVVARKMNEMSKIVFSRTLKKAEWSNTELVKNRVAEKVRGMKRQPGKNLIIFGSANLSATLTKNGLIDEYRIMVNPILLGKGRPLFPSLPGRLPLDLLSARVFPSGNVLLTYQLSPTTPKDRKKHGAKK
jgi:dihydrofolate reductase